MNAVDDLNLKYGIMHMNIKPCKIVINCETWQIQIFDFDFSQRITPGLSYLGRDDVSGVLFTIYEMITGDENPRMDYLEKAPSDPHLSNNIEKIEWVKQPTIRLDHDISEYRKIACDWAAKRRQEDVAKRAAQSPQRIDFPDLSCPPLKPSVWLMRDGTEEIVQIFSTRSVEDMKNLGEYYIRWQRPAQVDMKRHTRILANGKRAVKVERDEFIRGAWNYREQICVIIVILLSWVPSLYRKAYESSEKDS